jgi:hypothetical protein
VGRIGVGRRAGLGGRQACRAEPWWPGGRDFREGAAVAADSESPPPARLRGPLWAEQFLCRLMPVAAASVHPWSLGLEVKLLMLFQSQS